MTSRLNWPIAEGRAPAVGVGSLPLLLFGEATRDLYASSFSTTVPATSVSRYFRP